MKKFNCTGDRRIEFVNKFSTWVGFEPERESEKRQEREKEEIEKEKREKVEEDKIVKRNPCNSRNNK
jgi:hypothetical protein